MTDNMEARAKSYDLRVARAGSTENIIGGLVKGVKRNERVTRWLGLSLAFLLILSFILGTVILVVIHNTNEIKAKAQEACVQSAKNSVVVNQFLGFLIDNAVTSTVLTQAEKTQRIAGYKALIIKIPDCYVKAQ